MAKFGGGYGAKRFKKLDPYYQYQKNLDEEDNEAVSIGSPARSYGYGGFNFPPYYANTGGYGNYRNVIYLSPINWRI